MTECPRCQLLVQPSRYPTDDDWPLRPAVPTLWWGMYVHLRVGHGLHQHAAMGLATEAVPA